MNVLTSCRIGSRHVKGRKPCQDRYRVLTAGDRQIFLIADGHGYKSHCRCIPAAIIACDVAAKTLSNPDIPFELAPQVIKARFDQRVQLHMQRHPFSFQERQLLYGYHPTAAYGTTLLCCVVSPSGTFLLRLGDGEIHAMKADGTFYPALKGKLVSSMFSPDAARNMETAFYPEPAAAVMMFSDGFRSAEEHPTALLRQLAEPEAAAIREETLLAGDCGDDQTVILAMDREVVTAPDFQNAIQDYLRGDAARKEAARLDGELRRCRAELDGLIHKLSDIGPQSKDWDRVFGKLLEQGGDYAALAQQRKNVMEGGG